MPNTGSIIPASIDALLLPIAVKPKKDFIPQQQQAALYVTGIVQQQTRSQLHANSLGVSNQPTFLATPEVSAGTALQAAIQSTAQVSTHEPMLTMLIVSS